MEFGDGAAFRGNFILGKVSMVREPAALRVARGASAVSTRLTFSLPFLFFFFPSLYQDGLVVRHGHGTNTAGDGTVYVGEWDADKMHGIGRLTMADGVRGLRCFAAVPPTLFPPPPLVGVTLYEARSAGTRCWILVSISFKLYGYATRNPVKKSGLRGEERVERRGEKKMHFF